MSAISLHAKASADFEAKLARTIGVLREAATAHAGTVVQSTSLGAEDMVITDLIARHQLPIPLATLDTRALHDETLALIGQIEQHYGLPVEVFSPPQEAVIEFVGKHGPKAMYESIELRKACCGFRKLEPLGRLMAGRDAWVTGLRREQSGNRAEVSFSEVEPNGRTKYSPLAEWTWGDVWHYIALNAVPYNALHDQFYPSIGCAPCTRAISLGEDFRAGRWWWEDENAKECGLHVHGAHEELPAFEPAPATSSLLPPSQRSNP
jgi:phosphoadenosine phosphosulfate reductase